MFCESYEMLTGRLMVRCVVICGSCIVTCRSYAPADRPRDVHRAFSIVCLECAGSYGLIKNYDKLLVINNRMEIELLLINY